MNANDILKQVRNDSELAKSLAEALGRNADASELSEILLKAGIAAEEVDTLVSEYQRRRGQAISDEDVDEEALRKVAGGGSGINCTYADDCDDTFKDSSWWGMERCKFNENCDEYFCQINSYEMQCELADKINEKLVEDDGMLEDEAMLKHVAGGQDGDLKQATCPKCGHRAYGMEMFNRCEYTCSNCNYMLSQE